MFSKILVPCDMSYGASDWLNPSLSIVWDMAQKYGSEIIFLTVVPENLLKGYYPDVYEASIADEALARLRALVEVSIPDGTKVTCLVREGGICPEIINAAKELSVDLIAMASHGPLVRDYLLGSNATHVALHVPCSVLILRHPQVKS